MRSVAVTSLGLGVDTSSRDRHPAPLKMMGNGVDLHVDSQPGPIRMYTICIEPRARHMKNLFIESVQCS